MTIARLNRRQLLQGLALGVGALSGVVWREARAAPLPPKSIYRLDAGLVDQDGRAFRLADLQGTPLVVSMFYANCDMVCPLIFETIKAAIASAGPRAHDALRVLMVSFDPARDDVPALRAAATAHGVDARWIVARAEPDTVRQIAAVLGVQYRRLASGSYNHATVIEVVDPDGVIVQKSQQLGGEDAGLVAALRAQAH